MSFRFVIRCSLLVYTLSGLSLMGPLSSFGLAAGNEGNKYDCSKSNIDSMGENTLNSLDAQRTLQLEIDNIVKELAKSPKAQFQSVIEIDEETYRNNIAFFSRELSKRGRKLCSVLKNDGYGHGVKNLAQAAVEGGSSYLAIVDNSEAKDIRSLGITCPIIRIRAATMGEIVKSKEQNLDIEEVVGALDQALFLSDVGVQSEKEVQVHIQLDVGMGRMGIDCDRQKGNLNKICSLPGIKIVGIMTHFSEADKNSLDTTRKQLKQFKKNLKEIIPQLPKNMPVVIHASNSAAALRMDLKSPPESKDHFLRKLEKLARKHSIPISFMVRIGTATYGLEPLFAPLPAEVGRVMTFKSQVALIRPMAPGSTIGYHVQHKISRPTMIATIPVGSANGIEFNLSNKGHVLIGGKRRLILGVTSHMIMVDVTDDSDSGTSTNVIMGEEVVIIGKQESEEIRAEEIANLVGTDAGVILGNIGNKNPYRVVKKEIPSPSDALRKEWRKLHDRLEDAKAKF